MPVAPRWIVTALTSAAVVACLWSGVRIWTAPVRSEVVETRDDGSVSTPRFQNQRFAEVSPLGPFPLIVPVLISALGTWAAIRGRRWGVFSSAAVLAFFAILGGFSIGGSYRPAVYLLSAAAVTSFILIPGEPSARDA